MAGRRKSSILRCVTALAALFLCLAALPASASDPRTLFSAAVTADDSISYSGTLTSVIYQADGAQATVTRIEHRAPYSWRIWYVAPADAYGRLIISNEYTAYQYEPSQNKVYKNEWSEAAPDVAAPLDVSAVEQNYNVDLGPQTSVASRKATELSLVSKHTGSLVERLWVDAKTKLILRRESYHADGTIASRSGFDNIRIERNFPAAFFTLSVPAGMTLVEGTSYSKSTTDVDGLVASSKFKVIHPQNLPYGFELRKGGTAKYDGIDTVQLVYSDGLRSFSLFEYPSGPSPSFGRSTPRPIQIGNNSGQYADVVGQALASWSTEGLNLLIVGDLTPKEITKIGASVR